jgi:DNA polymerase-1
LGNVGKGKEWEEEDEEGNTIKVQGFKVRRAFGPAPGRVWFALDYQQLQLRIFAELAGEKGLQDAFDRGEDAHDAVAKALYSLEPDESPTTLQRREAKAVNFGYIFGKSASNLDKIRPGLGALTQSIFPNASKYLASTKSRLSTYDKDMGPHVFTRGGYRLFVPPKSDPRYDGDGARPYAGVCYEVQGAEGELVKRAMTAVRNYLLGFTTVNYDSLPEAFLTMQIHDELIIDFQYRSDDNLRDLSGDDLEDALGIYKTDVLMVKSIMEQAGKSLGFVTPASVSVVVDSWDKVIELEW